ncbi:MAG TPA: SMP-30/gluconolactonase/LRE family protein [Ornithinimicrobium sp.]|nr:SMP-30/gluconolactonase/LRE family protein [Ornithinimicrobium sp.]
MVLLDGMAVLPSGDLVVATRVVGQLTTLTPQGEVVARVDVGDPFVTNVCLAGDDGADWFVTLGSTGRLLRLRARAADDRPVPA